MTNWDGKRPVRQVPNDLDLFTTDRNRAAPPPVAPYTGFHPAFEVMTLALVVTQTSAELHEAIAKIATELSGRSAEGQEKEWDRVNRKYVDSISRLDARLASPAGEERVAKNPVFQPHIESLSGICQAIERAKVRFTRLESSNNAMVPAVLETFVGDCRRSLNTFGDVCDDLTQLLERLPEGDLDATGLAIDVLCNLLSKLTPSVERVANLPAAATAASSQCFAVTARDLQLRASRFQAGFDRPH